MGMKACCSSRDTIAGTTREECRSPSLRAEPQALSKVTVFVGLDYPKGSVQVCILDPAGQVLANLAAVEQQAAGAGVTVPQVRGGDGRSGENVLGGDREAGRKLIERALSLNPRFDPVMSRVGLQK